MSGPVGMIRKWNPGSDLTGPPDEVVPLNGYQPTEEDHTEGVRDPSVIDQASEEAVDAADD